MESFVRYLSEKLVAFESACTDIECADVFVKPPALAGKFSESSALTYLGHIVAAHRCYHVVDVGNERALTHDDAKDLVQQYKQYKQAAQKYE